MLFTIDALLFATAGIATALLGNKIGAARRRARSFAATELAVAGLEANGDLLGAYAARLQPTDVVIWNRKSHARPGATGRGDEVCLAQIGLPLADQIVCKAADADSVMGPLPAVPRVRTGHTPFDGAYHVFVGASGGGAPATSYRAAPAGGDVPWAQPELLDRLVELDLLWMRVHDGRAEIAFPPLEAGDVVRAAALARAIEKAVSGSPFPRLVHGPRTARPGILDAGKGLVAVYPGAILTGLTFGILTALVLGGLDVDAELACGPRSHIYTKNKGIIGCTPQTFDMHPDLYLLACMALTAALVLLLAIALVARSTTNRTPPGPADEG